MGIPVSRAAPRPPPPPHLPASTLRRHSLSTVNSLLHHPSGKRLAHRGDARSPAFPKAHVPAAPPVAAQYPRTVTARPERSSATPNAAQPSRAPAPSAAARLAVLRVTAPSCTLLRQQAQRYADSHEQHRPRGGGAVSRPAGCRALQREGPRIGGRGERCLVAREARGCGGAEALVGPAIGRVRDGGRGRQVEADEIRRGLAGERLDAHVPRTCSSLVGGSEALAHRGLQLRVRRTDALRCDAVPLREPDDVAQALAGAVQVGEHVRWARIVLQEDGVQRAREQRDVGSQRRVAGYVGYPPVRVPVAAAAPLDGLAQHGDGAVHACRTRTSGPSPRGSGAVRGLRRSTPAEGLPATHGVSTGNAGIPGSTPKDAPGNGAPRVDSPARGEGEMEERIRQARGLSAKMHADKPPATGRGAALAACALKRESHLGATQAVGPGPVFARAAAWGFGGRHARAPAREHHIARREREAAQVGPRDLRVGAESGGGAARGPTMGHAEATARGRGG
eukprot:1289686-Prymnesium_polylepis.2